MMKAYKHILFLLFFGLLTLQQVHADNVGKFTLQKVANLSDDAAALTGYSKLGTIEEVYVTENHLSKLKTVEIYKNADGVLAWRALAQAGGGLIDDILDIAKTFDDNVLDIAEVGLKNWKTFENRFYSQLKAMYPTKKIGSQITLDITYVENGITKTKTIIPDALIQIEVNGVRKYKVIDAKTSTKDLVNKTDLTSICTNNQKEIYPLIDAGGSYNGITITKVEMRGQRAIDAFGSSETFTNAGKAQIQLETGVEFWVNTNNTDFTQYLIRQRIK